MLVTWKTKIVRISAIDVLNIWPMEEELNKWEGWELVSVFDIGKDKVFIFKGLIAE